MADLELSGFLMATATAPTGSPISKLVAARAATGLLACFGLLQGCAAKVSVGRVRGFPAGCLHVNLDFVGDRRPAAEHGNRQASTVNGHE